jgi:hypothetical protein
MADPPRVAPLLDLDPDLGEFLDDERRDAAQRTLLARVRRVGKGPWDISSLHSADPGHLGLLMLDGVLSREVLAADVISTELIGPGELLRPWQLAPDASLLRVSVRWTVLADARVAVIDRRLTAQLALFPEITSLLVERLTARSQRLAVSQAIAQLNRVDQRLLTLFWHIAERWGRMTVHGVAIPLTLSHRMLAQLVGARRPTVSTAIGELTQRGEVRRLDDGSWLLTGQPVGEPAATNTRLIPPRRRMLVAVPESEPPAARPAVATATRVGMPEELMARLHRVRADCQRVREELDGGYATSVELFRRAAEFREHSRAPRAS